MDLLEEIASDEFYFIQHAVYLCIMLRTGDLDGIYVYSNDLVEIFGELDGVASDLYHQHPPQPSMYPTKCVDDSASLTLTCNEPCQMPCYTLRRHAIPSLLVHPDPVIVP